jgi:hypothetical protein
MNSAKSITQDYIHILNCSTEIQIFLELKENQLGINWNQEHAVA